MAEAAQKHDVDLLVVGTGNGGLVSALCAYELGVKNVRVIEKSAKYGGTSGRQGSGRAAGHLYRRSAQDARLPA